MDTLRSRAIWLPLALVSGMGVACSPGYAQLIQTIAGSGVAGFNGDGSPGNELQDPFGIALDKQGNLYIADTLNSRIRVVNRTASTITVAGVSIPPGNMMTVAGNGTAGFSGDGQAAVNAELNNPFGVAVDTQGNIYVADLYNYRVRKVDKNGIITTIAGQGHSAYGGDNGPAVNATLYPYALAVDAAGNLYIADTTNERIRAINMTNNVINVGSVSILPGYIATVAGNGAYGPTGSGVPATSAALTYPYAVALDSAANIYICDTYSRTMRVVNTGTSPITVASVTIQPGNIATIAGDGTYGYKDGGTALSAEFADPDGIAVDSVGNVYVSDLEGERIRLINNSTGLIMTIAGVGGTYGYNGDNIPALSAYLSYPRTLAVDGAGNVYFADQPNERIREVVVNPAAAAFISSSVPAFIVGSPKNFAVITNYWPTPRLTRSGTLPAGLTFVDNGNGTANISGTAASGSQGTYNLTITASNGVFPNAVQNLTLTVFAPGGVSVSSAAAFISKDTATEGNWSGSYGTDGYDIANSSQVTPPYASLAVQNQFNYTWADNTSDPTALQKPGSSSRIASTWYSNTSFSFDVNVGTNPHKVAIYALDWRSQGRTEIIQVQDATTGFLLDSQVLFNFGSGTYLSWNISGHVQIQITALSGANAVVSGVFFGGSGPGLTPFVSSAAVGTPRNNYTGWVGMLLRVGSNPITVNSLGRIVVSGNNGTHTVKFVDASNGTDLPGGSAAVNTVGGAAGAFAYANLANPVVLNAGALYYLVSQESAGGDQWYDHDTTLQTKTIASVTNAVYTSGSSYVLTGNPGQSYVPVDFQYGTTYTGPPIVTQQPQSASVIAGQSATFSVGASSGSPLSYQWQSQPPGGSTFVNIPGATSSTYTTPAAQAGDNGTQFLCIVSNSSGSVITVPVALSVQPAPPPNITQQPQSVTVSIGQSAVFSVGATGIGLMYQWQSRPSSTGTFANITGATASNYTTPPAQAADTGTQFQCIVGNGTGATTTNTVTLTVRPPGSATPFVTATTLGKIRNDFSGWVGVAVRVGSSPLTVNALGRFVAPGNSASHTVKIVDGATGTDVPGASVSISTSSVQPGGFVYINLSSPVTLNANGLYFVLSLEILGGDQWYDKDTLLQTNAVASIVSAVYSSGSTYVQLGSSGQSYVPVDFEYGGNTSTGPPTITQQPQNATVVVGQSASFTVAATSSTTLTYQWQSQAPGATTFSNISGATSSSYTTPILQATDSGTQFQCIVSNSSASVTSSAATVTVQVPSTGTPYTTSLVTGSARNNYTGWVGASITVSTSPVTVTALGRIFISGNAGTHAIKIVNATTGADVSGGSVSVSMSGGTAGSFVYANLSTPVVLSPNTTYFVLTQETAGGDQWYDYNTAASTSWVAGLNGAVYGNGAPYTVVASSAGHLYGPVDFKYSVPPTAFVRSVSLGTLRNDFTGWIGMELQVGNVALTVSTLGRMAAPGNTGTHVVKLVSATGADIAGGSVSVNTSGASSGSFVYVALGAPIKLNANTVYYLVTQETVGADLWYDLDSTIQNVPVGSIVTPVYNGGGSYTTITPNRNGHSYGPLDFQFQ
ncbi:MAG TPA: hypothetical protein VKX49_18005 [Bryobacteraceae bacterium]|nr:hypothetical protein [Bryobacteraceae bacterium]